jgi:Xaa-Pro dipeptidase
MEMAARATDASIEAIFARLAEGVGESELAAASLDAMLRAGSHYPIFQPFVTSAVRSALPHAVWSDHRVQRDETLFVEISASVLRYHAPAIRTGVLGSCPEAERCYDVCEEAFQAAVATMRPGAVTGDVDHACRSVIAKAGCGPFFKLRTGYQVGIDWTTRGSVSLMPGGKVELQPNMTFHVRPLLQVAGRFSVGCSETVVVGENAARCLTKYPRLLHRPKD